MTARQVMTMARDGVDGFEIREARLTEGDITYVDRKDLAATVHALWPHLADAERLAIMQECCTYCGTTDLPCYCAPGYDV